MTAKDFILEIPKMDILIERKREEIERLKMVAEGVSGSGNQERVATTKNNGKMENAISKYMEIEDDIAEIEQKRKSAMMLIEKLDFDLYDILYLRYLNKEKKTGEYRGMSFQEIADMKKRSYSWVTKMHKVALRQLEAIIKK